MNLNSPQPRKEIKNLSPYTPGKSIEQVKNELNLNEIIKLASNENIWGASPKAIDNIKKELNKIYLYPQSEPIELKNKLSEKLKVSNNEIIFGNGTDEIIELIAKTYLSNEDNIVISENSFVRYKMAGILMGSEIIEVPQKDLKIDIENILSNINEKTKAVFIDNPCNPTGTFNTKSQMEDFLVEIEKAPHRPIIVIDEAYYEYTTSEEYTTALKFRDLKTPLIILRTFSKIYGLAGLRIGYGISNKEIISNINRIRPPFNTNRLAQAAAAGAIDDDEFIQNSAGNTKIEKEYLYNEFKKLNIDYIPSQTNFILVKLGKENVNNIVDFLLKTGIILRPLKGYNLDDYIRITVGRRKHNKKLINSIKEILNRK
ncbi:MAG: histidinol-phosphate transaminase [Elusimicrobiota bacterium]